MRLVTAVRLIVAVLAGALVGGLLAGWIGIPFGAAILPLVVLAAIAVRRQWRQARAGRTR